MCDVKGTIIDRSSIIVLSFPSYFRKKKKKLLCVRENIVTCVWAGSRRVWRVQPANIVIYYKFILFVLKGLFCQDDVEATYVSICFSCI